MAGRRDFYFGRAGQLVVMAEFLRRGYNAAIPEIDMGEDIFVVDDATGALSRIQVKSAIGKGTQSMRGVFNVSRKQLQTARQPDLWYVFAVHHAGLWREFLILRRAVLWDLHEVRGAGRVTRRREAYATFYIAFHKHDVLCNGIRLQEYRNNWDN